MDNQLVDNRATAMQCSMDVHLRVGVCSQQESPAVWDNLDGVPTEKGPLPTRSFRPMQRTAAREVPPNPDDCAASFGLQLIT